VRIPDGQFSRHAFYKMFLFLSYTNLKGTGDYKLLDRVVVDAWTSMPENKLFYRGMVSWLGFSHAEMPFISDDRRSGGSKWSFF